MKILHISTSDIIGGAARAAYRLHNGLRDIGVDSYMYVQRKNSDDLSVLSSKKKLSKLVSLIKPHLDLFPLKRYPSRSSGLFTPAIIKDNLTAIIKRIDPDIVHLHWLGHAFFRIETLSKIKKPIVWTMHDMWAITGGCHYSSDCTGFHGKCGKCPALGSNKENDLSRRVWERKKRAWRGIRIEVVSPSRWLAENIKSSSLLKDSRVNVIPNGIDSNQFKPIEKEVARNILSLPADKKLILFGALNSTSDKRKGYQLLEQAIKILENKGLDSEVELIVFGSNASKKLQSSRFNIRYVGQLNDECSLSVLYSAVDVFVAPSIQDNLPNTVMESLSCGTPVVAFDIGGMPDMISHKCTGYLAKPYKGDDLAEGISWILDNSNRWTELSANCRTKVVNEYKISHISERYNKLYNELL